MSEYKFHPIIRTWVTADDDTKRSCYLQMEGRVSLTDLLRHLDSVIHPSVDNTDNIYVNFGTIRWEEPSTEQERAERAEQRRNSAARKAAWEKKTYAELKAKFEGTNE